MCGYSVVYMLSLFEKLHIFLIDIESSQIYSVKLVSLCISRLNELGNGTVTTTSVTNSLGVSILPYQISQSFCCFEWCIELVKVFHITGISLLIFDKHVVDYLFFICSEWGKWSLSMLMVVVNTLVRVTWLVSVA